MDDWKNGGVEMRGQRPRETAHPPQGVFGTFPYIISRWKVYRMSLFLGSAFGSLEASTNTNSWVKRNVSYLKWWGSWWLKIYDNLQVKIWEIYIYNSLQIYISTSFYIKFLHSTRSFPSKFYIYKHPCFLQFYNIFSVFFYILQWFFGPNLQSTFTPPSPQIRWV